eukprot:352022-Chlamydomonas_euryale.AAC.2
MQHVRTFQPTQPPTLTVITWTSLSHTFSSSTTTCVQPPGRPYRASQQYDWRGGTGRAARSSPCE